MLVKEILSAKPARLITVRPDAPLSEAVRIMSDEKIGSILVVDEDGKLGGIFSERDLLRVFARHGPDARRLPVSELASTSVITCREDNTLEDVLTLMSNNTIRHLPVTRDGSLVGIISARDLMDAQKRDLLAALTRQKQAASVLRRAKNQAEEANRTKTEFMSRMSHELRTPLNAIIGFSDIIHQQRLGGIGNAEYADYAGEIGTAGRQLLKAINDILAITRLESGRRRIEEDELDLPSHISACLARFGADAAAKKIVLDYGGYADGVRLLSDAPMLDRMLDNLVSNAIKFTPDGGRVTIAPTRDGKGDLLISVADTGVGIDAEKADALLTPFSQADGSLERKYGGMGLGLALVNMMVRMHEGSVEIESAPGAGATVTLRFPASRVRFEDKRRAAAI